MLARSVDPLVETLMSLFSPLQFDVAVIGAGPAGSAAALAAARYGEYSGARDGARVLLVDRAQFPRAKVCGSCLTDEGIATIHSIGATRALVSATPLRSVRVTCAAREICISRPAGVAIAREMLDTALLEEAQSAGVDVRLATSARVRPDRTLELACGDQRFEARASTVIVADGLAGNALDEVDGFTWRIAKRSHMGFGAILPAGSVQCAPGEICMRVVDGGYIGAVQLASGEIDVAAAIDPRLLRAAKNVALCARDMLGEAVLESAALERARWRGTPLLTRRRARVAAEGILVVGDAAGYVEPFTGEGMTWALSTGAAAGTLAATHTAPHQVWPRRYAALTRAPRLRCALLSRTLRAPRFVRAMLALGERFPLPFASFARSLGCASHICNHESASTA